MTTTIPAAPMVRTTTPTEQLESQGEGNIENVPARAGARAGAGAEAGAAAAPTRSHGEHLVPVLPAPASHECLVPQLQQRAVAPRRNGDRPALRHYPGYVEPYQVHTDKLFLRDIGLFANVIASVNAKLLRHSDSNMNTLLFFIDNFNIMNSVIATGEPRPLSNSLKLLARYVVAGEEKSLPISNPGSTLIFL